MFRALLRSHVDELLRAPLLRGRYGLLLGLLDLGLLRRRGGSLRVLDLPRGLEGGPLVSVLGLVDACPLQVRARRLLVLLVVGVRVLVRLHGLGVLGDDLLGEGRPRTAGARALDRGLLRLRRRAHGADGGVDLGAHLEHLGEGLACSDGHFLSACCISIEGGTDPPRPPSGSIFFRI